MALRQFCAVARPATGDDIGFDAVCTLLRGRGREQTASNSFLVQIKSATKDSELYKAAAVEWLVRNELPLFFATYVRDRELLRVFSLDAYFRVTRGWTPSSIRFVFADVVPLKWKAAPEGRIHIPLGPPVLEVTTNSLRSDGGRENAVRILGSWVQRDQETLSSSKIGLTRPSVVRVGEEPGSRGLMMNVNPADLQADLDRCFPGYAKLIGQVAAHGSTRHDGFQQARESASVLTRWLSQRCIDPEVRHLYQGLEFALVAARISSSDIK